MRGDVPKAGNIAAGVQAEPVSLEKQQELLLMNKLASGGKLPPKSASSFLQKRLQQRKFFDSGDYNMNKDKKAAAGQQQPPPPPTAGTPATAANTALPKLATPMEEVPAAVVPMAANANKIEEAGGLSPTLRPPAGSFSGGSLDGGDSDSEEHLQIPRPDTVPQRKSSILHPSAHSKLSPQPHIHHEHPDESLSMPQPQ